MVNRSKCKFIKNPTNNETETKEDSVTVVKIYLVQSQQANVYFVTKLRKMFVELSDWGAEIDVLSWLALMMDSNTNQRKIILKNEFFC